VRKVKLFTYLGLLSFILFFTACSRSTFYDPRHMEDLNRMLYVLENNFALFDVAHWARGVDIYAIVENVRETLHTTPYMSDNDFFHVLRYAFDPLVGIGHFQIISRGYYDYMVRGEGRLTRRWWYSDEAHMRLRAPHVLDFYAQLEAESLAFGEWMEAFPVEFSRMSSTLIEQLRVRGETTLADDFAQAIALGNETEVGNLWMEAVRATENNVTTRILEEGRIAYLAIDSFMRYPIPPEEERQILNFYEEIAGFDHLIIDLRFNGGGMENWFFRTVLEPNIDREFVLEQFFFLSYGEYAAHYTGGRRGNTGGRRIVDRAQALENHRPVAEILATYPLPDLHLPDMARMDYGFRAFTTVRPRAYAPHFSYEPSFAGEIWLLTGPITGSAAQISAWATRETGFATIVGEISGGNFGGERTLTALPNTGIAFILDLNYVTDSRGRPLEAGTIPDIFNHEGKTALETVLAVIHADNKTQVE